MTIEELLNKLETERKALEDQYHYYYDRAAEAKKEIKDFYEDPFVSPTNLPEEMMSNYVYWTNKHTDTVHQHNRILSAINTIKERAGI
jgi:hypothetical protein